MPHANLALTKHNDAKEWGHIHKTTGFFSPMYFLHKDWKLSDNIKSLKSPEKNAKLTQKLYETNPISRYIPTFNTCRELAKVAFQHFH